MFREEDAKLFEMNYVEFIRRDKDGSELNTRRIASELLNGIVGNYKGKFPERFSAQIHNCLALFAENLVANWKYNDCAIYLVVSLATKKAGSETVVNESPTKVNWTEDGTVVDEFYSSHLAETSGSGRT